MIYPTTDTKMANDFMSIQSGLRHAKALVPEILGEDLTLGYMLIEDLGDLTLERRFFNSQKFDKTRAFYYKAIDEIIKIHSIEIDKEQPTPYFHVEFDTAKLLWELNYMKRNLLQDFFKLEMSPGFLKDLDQDFKSLCNHLSNLPQVVCHRDYHSRNIMIHKNQTYVIDFQDARLGPCQYDLVSLYRDSYVDLSDEIEAELLEYYFENMNEKITLDWDSFKKNYQLQALQRPLKACGSFSSFYNQKQDQRYLKYIQPTLERTNALMKHVEGFPALKLLFTEFKLHTLDTEKS